MTPLRALAPALLLCVPLSGCAPSPTTGGFKSDDPAAKLYAINDAARRRDRAAIPDLIDALWSDDPAVRLLAEETLEEITGQDVGYRHFDPPEQRAAAIARWTALARREGWLAETPAAEAGRSAWIDLSSPTPDEPKLLEAHRRPWPRA